MYHLKKRPTPNIVEFHGVLEEKNFKKGRFRGQIGKNPKKNAHILTGLKKFCHLCKPSSDQQQTPVKRKQ